MRVKLCFCLPVAAAVVLLHVSHQISLGLEILVTDAALELVTARPGPAAVHVVHVAGHSVLLVVPVPSLSSTPLLCLGHQVTVTMRMDKVHVTLNIDFERELLGAILT